MQEYLCFLEDSSSQLSLKLSRLLRKSGILCVFACPRSSRTLQLKASSSLGHAQGYGRWRRNGNGRLRGRRRTQGGVRRHGQDDQGGPLPTRHSLAILTLDHPSSLSSRMAACLLKNSFLERGISRCVFSHELAVEGSFHGQVQVFGDGEGNVIHLGEREVCLSSLPE